MPQVESESREHLRAALSYLDKGEDKSAEQELKLSLESDPFNSRARTTLASLYAKQANISLKDWLDPFWEAGRQLGGKLSTFQHSSDAVDELSEGLESATSKNKESLNDEQLAMRERVTRMATDATKFLLGAAVAIDVFNSIPMLNDEELIQLDKAIDSLRVQEIAPKDRDEESRVYLSVLSFIRLVNHLKRLLGDSNTYKISLQRERLCSLDSDKFKHHLDEIRLSLSYLEEGLVISPSDPETSQRAIRGKFQKFISDFLMNPVWDYVDDLFDKKTIEGRAAYLIAYHLCPELRRDEVKPEASASPVAEASAEPHHE